MSKKYFIVLICLLSVTPLIASADGLVPCGGQGEADCTFCHIFVLLQNVLNFIVLGLVPPVAALFFAIAGFILLTSGGVPSKKIQAKKIITQTIYGVIIIYGAWALVNSLILWIGTGGISLQGWSKFTCE